MKTFVEIVKERATNNYRSHFIDSAYINQIKPFDGLPKRQRIVHFMSAVKQLLFEWAERNPEIAKKAIEDNYSEPDRPEEKPKAPTSPPDPT